MEKGFGVCIQYIKKKMILSDQLSGFEDDLNKVLRTVKRTIAFVESYNIVLVDHSGHGKSKLLVESVLNTVSSESYVLVKLNGLIHTNDCSIVASIKEQLHIEDVNRYGLSFYEYYSDIFVEVYRRTKKPLIFVLDEFEHFCSNHLIFIFFLECAQYDMDDVPFFTCGLTLCNRIDELLTTEHGLRYTSFCKITMKPPTDPKKLLMRLHSLLSISADCNVSHNILRKWVRNIDLLVEDERIINLTRDFLKFSSSYTTFYMLIFTALTNKSGVKNSFTVEDLTETYHNLKQKNKNFVHLLELSALPLLLMTSICHQSEIYKKEPFSFDMIYARYYQFASCHSTLIATKKDIVRKDFDRLLMMQLIQPVNKYIHKEHWLSKSPDKNQVVKCDYYKLPPIILEWININYNGLY